MGVLNEKKQKVFGQLVNQKHFQIYLVLSLFLRETVYRGFDGPKAPMQIIYGSVFEPNDLCNPSIKIFFRFSFLFGSFFFSLSFLKNKRERVSSLKQGFFKCF